MAEGSVTQTGVEELKALYRQLPARVDAVALRVAHGTGNAMVVQARTRLLRPQPPVKSGSSGANDAIQIDVVDDLPNKAVLVEARATGRYPANLVLWTEFGTIHQPARPFMAPAGHAVQAQYERDFNAAMTQLAGELSS